VGVKGSRSVSRLSNRHFFFVFLARLQDIGSRPPITLGNFCEIPGMTFSAGEVTTGLVNGKVIFRTGKVDGRDQPEEAIVGLFESGFTGGRFPFSPLFDLNETVSLGISLLNQITFHHKILSHAISPLQVILTV
jgi:hypothetical protein